MYVYAYVCIYIYIYMYIYKYIHVRVYTCNIHAYLLFVCNTERHVRKSLNELARPTKSCSTWRDQLACLLVLVWCVCLVLASHE